MTHSQGVLYWRVGAPFIIRPRLRFHGSLTVEFGIRQWPFGCAYETNLIVAVFIVAGANTPCQQLHLDRPRRRCGDVTDAEINYCNDGEVELVVIDRQIESVHCSPFFSFLDGEGTRMRP